MERLPQSWDLTTTVEMLEFVHILIIVGYGMKFAMREFGRPLLVVVARLALTVPLALVLSSFVIRRLLNLDPLFAHALFTILILPPPFIIPIFMSRDDSRDMRYVNNTLTIHTVVTITIFIVYLLIMQA
jgi:hypothetical protein